MLERTDYRDYLPYLIIIIAYLVFSLPYSPFLEHLGYDKEIFQYIGMTIKNNLKPYSDTFDHKPPLIYLLNYLGVLLTPGSTWGIFSIMNLIGFISSLLIYRLSLSKSKDFILSIFITVLYISLINHISLLQGGNLTRQFTTYLSTVILFIVFGTRRSNFNCVLLGFLIGTVFFMQQNEILSGSIVIVYYLFFEKDFVFSSLKKSFFRIGYFVCGLLVPFISTLYLINFWDNFDDFIYQVFLFNVDSYINKDSFVRKILNTLYKLLTFKSLIGVALLSVMNIGYNVIMNKKINMTPPLAVIAISFLFQIVSTSISGKLYGHYFLMFIPYAICLFIFSLKDKNHKYLNLFTYGLVIVIALSSIRPWSYTKPDKRLFALLSHEIEYLKDTPGQFYTFNPQYLRVNFELNINAPTKYIYTHFFDKNDYDSLIKSFETNSTKYILYHSEKIIPKELKSFISSNYSEVIRNSEYILYKHN